jgi:hypothetical protein
MGLSELNGERLLERSVEDSVSGRVHNIGPAGWCLFHSVRRSLEFEIEEGGYR